MARQLVRIYPAGASLQSFICDFKRASATEVEVEVMYGSVMPFDARSAIEKEGWTCRSTCIGTYLITKPARMSMSVARIGSDMYSLREFISAFKRSAERSCLVRVHGACMTYQQRDALRAEGWSVKNSGLDYIVEKSRW